MNSPSERLRQRVRRAGPLPFLEFMEEALYGEGGYYRTAHPRIGPDGDFVTGASLSPLFGRSTRTLLQRLARRLGGKADLLEAGYGDASHLAAVSAALGPDASTRLLAWDRVERPVPTGVIAVPDLSDLVASPLRGLVFSYELFDALPIRRLVKSAGDQWHELGVGLAADGNFRWVELCADSADLRELLGREAEIVQQGQIVDLAPGWRPLYRRLADSLERGLIVTCDYGFERRRLLDARVRSHGTLACYRRQRVHRDPFADVGRQDLTAHVDFTALMEEGHSAGLETVGLARQAEWLGACGVFAELEDADRATRLEAAQLMNLEGMGSEIRVLVQARGVDVEGLFDVELSPPRGSQAP